ncbi:MAG: hypothetical protein Q9224_002018 [Gallowayella concinna]
MPHDGKRQQDAIEPGAKLTALSVSKRSKLQNQQGEDSLRSFWDNLSKLWLTRCALQEFDRRTVWPTAPTKPRSTGAEHVDFAQLQFFAADGGPSLDDLRPYSVSNEADVETVSNSRPAMAHNNSRNSVYDRNFSQHMKDHGCYPPQYPEQRPANWDKVYAKLLEPRKSSAPLTQKDLDLFRLEWQKCKTESMVVSVLFHPIIAGASSIHQPNIFHTEDVQFNNLEPMTDNTYNPPKPDWYDGCVPEEIVASIRAKLSAYIVPSTVKDRPCLPNFFAEFKGPEAVTSVLERQALNNGTWAARGIQELRDWIGTQPLEDKRAYTICCTYDYASNTLNFFTVHPIRTDALAHRPLSRLPSHRFAYQMTKIDGWIVDKNLNDFNQAVNAFRNAREWCKKERDDLVKEANKKAKKTATADSLGPLDELA